MCLASNESSSRASIGFHTYVLQAGRLEEDTGGRTRASILEDAFEAMVGALYLDSDLATTRERVLAWYGPLAIRLAAFQHVERDVVGVVDADLRMTIGQGHQRAALAQGGVEFVAEATDQRSVHVRVHS